MTVGTTTQPFEDQPEIARIDALTIGGDPVVHPLHAAEQGGGGGRTTAAGAVPSSGDPLRGTLLAAAPSTGFRRTHAESMPCAWVLVQEKLRNPSTPELESIVMITTYLVTPTPRT